MRFLFAMLIALAPSAFAGDVTTAAGLRDAISNATPGTVIHLGPGHYAITSAMWTGAAGTASQPIRITSDDVATAVIDVDAQEGLVINHAYWVVEKVWINGVCAGGCNDSAGLHLKNTSDHFIGRNMRVTNFGENIKGDRTPDKEVADSAILDSELSNTAPEMSGGGTAIDLVGGKRWRIAGNYVHDYARDGVHYAIFLKGGTSAGVIEKNLVIGAKVLPHGSGAEVGISFGGGGTGPQFCDTTNQGASFCTCEDFNGVARNNLVIDVNDSAFHSKVACGSQFLNNTVVGSSPGLQVQIASTGAPVEAHNNVFSGGISGPATASDNLLNVSAFGPLYANVAAYDFAEGTAAGAIKDKGPALAKVTDDYFGSPRVGPNDWGAIEFPARGAVWPWGSVSHSGGGPDAGVDAGIQTGPSDSGVVSPLSDAGALSDAGVDGGRVNVGNIDPGLSPCGGCSGAPGAAISALVFGLWSLTRRSGSGKGSKNERL